MFWLQVRACLLSLPQTKWIFTNCNEKHARLALQTLGLEVRCPTCCQCFDLGALLLPNNAASMILAYAFSFFCSIAEWSCYMKPQARLPVIERLTSQ
jgi:hypothetical protein